MTTPEPSTYITGPGQPFLGAWPASLRRDRVQGLTLAFYDTWNEDMQSNQTHWMVQAVGAALAVSVLDTLDRAEAETYIATDPDGYLS